MTNVGIDNELVAYSEINPYASKALSVIHKVSEDLNLGDIKEIDETKLPYFDIMTWGFPCTNISIANVEGKGINEGKSSLYHEGLRVLKYNKPKYSIIENVKGLITKHKDQLEIIKKDLSNAGYNNYIKLYNATDFNIPQNRERVIIVSIRKDIDDGNFNFPIGQGLHTNWWEYLDLEDKSRKLTGRQKRMINAAKGLSNEEIKIEGDISWDKTVITLRQSGLRFQNNPEHPTVTAYYGKGGGNFTILAFNGELIGISPKNCFRLQGFDDEDYYKVKNAGISMSRQYEMIGNSIPVVILENIFKKLYL